MKANSVPKLKLIHEQVARGRALRARGRMRDTDKRISKKPMNFEEFELKYLMNMISNDDTLRLTIWIN